MVRVGVEGRLSAMWVILGACLLLLGFVDMFFSARLDAGPSAGPVRRSAGLLPTLMGGLVILAVLAQRSVERCLERREESQPQRTESAQGERCLVWASCAFQDLAEAVSTFCKVYIGLDRKFVDGGLTSMLPACKVAQDKTCACCLEDFVPSSEVAVLPCGHIYHRECIMIWSLSHTAGGACPICRTRFELPAV